MKKKILFLINDFRSGGAESVFVQLANFFSIKYEVHFMVLKAEGPNLKNLNERIKLIELKKRRSIFSIFKVSNYIRKYEIDIVLGTLSMAYVVSISKLFGSKNCKYIARIGSIISANLTYMGFFERFLMSKYQKVLNFSDVIITQSEMMRSDLKNYVKKDSVVIYNPVSSKKIQILSYEKPKINLSNNFFNIISVGRLSFEKDYKTAIYCISKLKKKINNIRYYILGEGDLKRELEIYTNSLGLSDDIIFTGYVENPYPIMKRSNVLLLTSLYEGFSNVILEALTLKVPVVATNSPGGNKEIISNGINGFLTEMGNSEDIVKKLVMIKNKKNFKINTIKFDINDISLKYENFF
tara:strand:- start:13920 stop:14978 length:1059 start_codon:yes stop_codon:yes gene_type:complete